jgi:hypothetical protein
MLYMKRMSCDHDRWHERAICLGANRYNDFQRAIDPKSPVILSNSPAPMTNGPNGYGSNGLRAVQLQFTRDQKYEMHLARQRPGQLGERTGAVLAWRA